METNEIRDLIAEVGNLIEEVEKLEKIDDQDKLVDMMLKDDIELNRILDRCLKSSSCSISTVLAIYEIKDQILNRWLDILENSFLKD